MLPVVLVVAIPFLVVGLVSYLGWLYGDEHFLLDSPPHELNRADDNRIVKLRLNSHDLIK
ncbi:MAG: hypothetical protein JNK87_25905 [Bryobacterales bacterium]|nr:hypothetical protein [Bryobacterales bacterium]